MSTLANLSHPSISESRFYKIAQATTLQEAANLNILDKIKDWFLGGVKKKAIENLFTAIQEIRKTPVPAVHQLEEHLNKFIELKNSVKPEYQKHFILEINHLNKNNFEYSLKIQDHVIFNSSELYADTDLLNLLRNYQLNGSLTPSTTGEINKTIVGEEADCFVSLLKEPNSATANKMSRDDNQFAPSEQFHKDVRRTQKLNFVRGNTETHGAINFAQQALTKDADEDAYLQYMDSFLDQLRQITSSDEVAFELTRHMQQGIFSTFQLAQQQYPSLLAPLTVYDTISPNSRAGFGIEKKDDGTFDITVTQDYDAIDTITHNGEKHITKQYMDPSRSYCHAKFVMNISADGKTVTGLSQPLTLNYQLTAEKEGEEYGSISKATLVNCDKILDLNAQQTVTPRRIIAGLTNSGGCLAGGKEALSTLLANSALFSSEHVELDLQKKTLIFKNLGDEFHQQVNQLIESGALTKKEDGSLEMALDKRIFNESGGADEISYGGVYIRRLLASGNVKFSSLEDLATQMANKPTWNFVAMEGNQYILTLLNPQKTNQFGVPSYDSTYRMDKVIADRIFEAVSGLDNVLTFDEKKNKFMPRRLFSV